MPHLPASPALSRYTVLDLTRVRAGPTCVRQLADWGANVIKVELPDRGPDGHALGGPRAGPDFQNLHRNKRSLTLNLKAAEGRKILLELVARRRRGREFPTQIAQGMGGLMSITGLPGQGPVRVGIPVADLVLLWHERSRQRRALMGLSDHMLRVIGCSRAEAHSEAAKSFWRA